MLKWVKLNRNKLIIAIIIILSICAILYLQFPGNQLLTDLEVEELIAKRGIEPILINDIGNSYTVIVYKNANSSEASQLLVYKNRFKKVMIKNFAFYKRESYNEMNAIYWSTNTYAYNLIGYVGIDIKNQEILSSAKSAKVILSNGIVEEASFNDSNILLLPSTRRFFWEKPVLQTIEIYDENGKVIDGFYSGGL